MSEGLWIVSVCLTNVGWQKPLIFPDSKREEMDSFIFSERKKLNTVASTRISADELEQLRLYLFAESLP
jgi:hypothetical protein